MPKGNAASRSPLDRFIAALTAHGYRQEHTAGGVQAQCPGHGGGDLNLSIDVRDDEALLLTCWSHGCDADAIVTPLGLTTRDLFARTGGNGGSTAARRAKVRPDLLDSHREHLLNGYAELLAFAPRLRSVLVDERALSLEVIALYRIGMMRVWKNGTGRFIVPLLSWRPGEEGRAFGYIAHLPKSMRGADEHSIDVLPRHRRWPLACLDEAVFDGSQPVVICEAEMDALAVRSAGHPAYGAPGAASWHDAHAQELREYGVRRAVVIGDRDVAGQQFNQKVVTSLARVGIACAAAEVPDA